MPVFGNTVTITESGEAIDAETPPQRRASLVMVAGPALGEVYAIAGDIVIGRDPAATLLIDDAAVSRQHVRIVERDGIHYIEDLGSANGTFIDGVRITTSRIENGDRIQLGPRVVLRFAQLDKTEEQMLRQLLESSTRDALTGAYNKRHFAERLTAEVAHANRHRSALELIVFDLDHFKHVNDQYGHLAGDAVLRAVADHVHALIRSEDVFARFGGEEFVLIVRGSNAIRLAERIRSAVEGAEISTERGRLRVTVSLGVARLDELESPASADMLIERADRRLLEAKRAGRNRICARDAT